LLDKGAIRREVWKLMEESSVSRFPKPVEGRIPNFEGSEKPAPREEHDFVVEALFAPSKVIRIERNYSQPRGIIWEKLTEHQISGMPILHELRKIQNRRK